jgi:uncharacterized protein YndB with AHSA1/START domain
MSERMIDVYRHADAPIETVWAVISDHRGYASWTPMPTSELEVEGSPEPDGVGAIRRLGAPPMLAREQVVAFDPPRSMSYTILSGMPVQGYRADVVLEPTSDGGTDIRWTGGFDAAPFGLSGVLRRVLATAISQLADGAMREANRRAGA